MDQTFTRKKILVVVPDTTIYNHIMKVENVETGTKSGLIQELANAGHDIVDKVFTSYDAAYNYLIENPNIEADTMLVSKPRKDQGQQELENEEASLSKLLTKFDELPSSTSEVDFNIDASKIVIALAGTGMHFLEGRYIGHYEFNNDEASKAMNMLIDDNGRSTYRMCDLVIEPAELMVPGAMELALAKIGSVFRGYHQVRKATDIRNKIAEMIVREDVERDSGDTPPLSIKLNI